MMLERLEDNLIALPTLERAAAALKVLAHPHRLRICELLLNERVPVKVIAEHLGIPQNATSQHLNMMKAHGILGCEREGKEVFYRVVDSRPSWLLGCIRDHASGPSASGEETVLGEKTALVGLETCPSPGFGADHRGSDAVPEAGRVKAVDTDGSAAREAGVGQAEPPAMPSMSGFRSESSG